MGLGFGGGLLAVVLGLILHLACKKPDLDVEFSAWNPPPPTEWVGPIAPNTLLLNAKRIAEGLVDGPESMVFDKEGVIYAGTVSGSIVAFDPKTQTRKQIAVVGGRPLGLATDPTGNTIYVADVVKGLLGVDKKTGKITLLANKANNKTITYANDIDVTSDGVVYFSESSAISPPYLPQSDSFDTLTASVFDIMSATPTGRLLKYDPKTGNTDVVASNIQFANGVAVAHDDSFVLVCETGHYDILRIWLKGPNAGKKEVFYHGLPGFPDGLSAGSNGTFWVAIFGPRTALGDAVHPYPLLKKIVLNLPPKLRVKASLYSLVLQLDSNGNIIRSLHDATGQAVGTITSVHEHHGKLYFGNLYSPFIGTYDLQK